MFTNPQNRIVLEALPKVKNQIGQEEHDKLAGLLNYDIDSVDANYLVGLLIKLMSDLSFNSRVEIIQDIQKELTRYPDLEFGKQGGGYRSYDDLKETYLK